MNDRYEIAWRIWCWQQGYVKAEDREGLRNWMREDDSQLHPNDIRDRDALLPVADMAIELTASVRKEQIRENLLSTRAVQAGWAFGVPEDGRDQWLDLVTRAVMRAYS